MSDRIKEVLVNDVAWIFAFEVSSLPDLASTSFEVPVAKQNAKTIDDAVVIATDKAAEIKKNLLAEAVAAAKVEYNTKYVGEVKL